MEKYVYIEFIALLIFVGRFLYYVTRPELKFDYENWLEFPLYLSLLFLNGMLYFFLKEGVDILEIYNIFVPSIILVSFVFKRRVKLPILIGLMILISGFLFYLNIYILNMINYNLVIVLMMWNAIKMSANSSRNLKRSFLYIIFSFDLLYTLVSYELGFVQKDWNHKNLIHLFSFLSIIIFSSTLIFSHLFLRKFFTKKMIEK